MLSPERISREGEPPLQAHCPSSEDSSSSTRPVASCAESHRQYGSVHEGGVQSPMRMRLAVASGVLVSAMLACLVYASSSPQSAEAVERLSNIYLNGSPALVSSVGYGSPAMQMPVAVNRQDTGAEWVQAAGQLIPVQEATSYGSLSPRRPLLNFPQPAATSQIYPSSIPMVQEPYLQAAPREMISQPLMMAPRQSMTPLTPLTEIPQTISGGVAMLPSYAAVQPTGFLAQRALIREISEQAGKEEAGERVGERREEREATQEQAAEQAKMAAARYGAAYGASYAAAYEAMQQRAGALSLPGAPSPVLAAVPQASVLVPAPSSSSPSSFSSARFLAPPQPAPLAFVAQPPPQPKPEYVVEHQVPTLGGPPIAAGPASLFAGLPYHSYALQAAGMGPHVQYMYSGNPLAAAARAVAQARGAAMGVGGE